MATFLGWTRTRLVSIVLWLLIVELVQFLVIVPLISLMGLGGVLLIMPIYLFVLNPLTISYKIIVIQSLVGDLSGQLEESMDKKLLDTVENSYDPARAL